MPDRSLLNHPQVAKRLGHSSDWFYRHRDRLIRDHGFPSSVDGCFRRWDPAAIDAWLDAQLPAAARSAKADDAAELARIEARREARGQAIADDLAHRRRVA